MSVKNGMVILSKRQLEEKKNFIDRYLESENAADGSKWDKNANVSHKNISTLGSEINKDIMIQINRHIVSEQIKKDWGDELSKEYIKQLELHEIYCHDESTIQPYTYGPSESIVVYRNDKKMLTTFDILYNFIYSDLNESILNKEEGVFVKYPNDLFIEDVNGKTKVERLIKKDRLRDLVRVKTKYGEDLIVTDNHPMIVDDRDINNNVEAINSLGFKQYKKNIKFEEEIYFVDIEKEFNFNNYGSYCINKENNCKKIEGIKSKIKLDEKLGYFIGFFIAEGNYSENNSINITQNDENKLKQIASYAYDSLGVVGKIYKDRTPSHKSRKVKHYLSYSSEFLTNFLRDYFLICEYSYRKSLPINILNTNREFIDGLLSGIIDGDGSADNDISIRLASRTIITQLSVLLKNFNFGFSMTYQEQNEEAFGSFSSNYPIFGINFGLTGDLNFNLSDKVNKNREKITKRTRYPRDCGVISRVEIIKNKSFLDTKIYDITTESRQFTCNNLQVHNCVSISIYPFLLDGMTKLGGESKAPKHLDSFCGSFINLCFAISSQFAGALGVPEFLMAFDHFARKDYGENYLETHSKEVESKLQHVIYSLNQPAAARGFQSIFFNISIFDKYYFEHIFEDFVFPDNFEKVEYKNVKKIQEYFMNWFNKERESSLLTFPVISACIISNENNEPKDKDFSIFISQQLASGNSFFIYQSDSADSLSSCCRLANKLTEKPQFSFSLGAGGIATGSTNVITLNLNRLFQDKNRYLEDEIDKIHKYQISHRRIIENFLNNGLLPVYDSNFISLDKQYLTIGLNGIVEAAEFLGIEPANNERYKIFLKELLETIYNKNRNATEQYGYMFNTEFVPAESLGVKFSQWDKKRKMKVNRDCYNSYFYRVEDEKLSIIDKFELHGKEITMYLDGGSALHLNLDEHYDADGYYKLICLAIKTGVPYFTTNVKSTCCEDCFHINKKTLDHCVKCGSKNISHATRIIGYLKKIKDFSQERREEHSRRYYH